MTGRNENRKIGDENGVAASAALGAISDNRALRWRARQR